MGSELKEKLDTEIQIGPEVEEQLDKAIKAIAQTEGKSTSTAAKLMLRAFLAEAEAIVFNEWKKQLSADLASGKATIVDGEGTALLIVDKDGTPVKQFSNDQLLLANLKSMPSSLKEVSADIAPLLNEVVVKLSISNAEKAAAAILASAGAGKNKQILLTSTGEDSSNDYLTIIGALPYQAIREAIYKNTFRQVEGSPWPTAILNKESIRGHAQLRPKIVDVKTLMPPEDTEKWSQIMWRQREELSDLDADAMDALSAIWLRQARTPQDDAVADVDGLLEMRGIKPKRNDRGYKAGYRPEQRTEMLRALSHIQNLWLDMAEIEIYEDNGKGRRKPKKQSVQSRAFVVTDRMGQMRLDGYMDVQSFIFRPGKVFAHFLFGPGRQTALLSAKAIQYDPYRQKWEKRLTRYLSWQWKCNAKNGCGPRKFRVSTLLEAIGESVDPRYPSKTKDHLEKALDTLQQDKVIAGWQYDQWNEEIISTQRGWSNVWLEANIITEPPDEIKEYYRQFERSRETSKQLLLPAATLPNSLGEKIRRCRKELKLSQLQAAEKLNISQPYFSLLEGGKIPDEKLSKTVQKRIQEWLGL